MSATILEGSVFEMLPTLEPGSVDCVVTSPPYWQLRSYLPKDHPLKPNELGSEPTIEEYIVSMVKVFRLVRECLAEHGTVWCNVGDTYSAGGCGGKNSLESGNLCLIPQRLAIALQDDGWLVRSVIVWHKPAPMPASVSGWAWRRCRVKVSSPAKAVRTKAAQCEDLPYDRDYSGGIWNAEKWKYTDCPGCEKCEPNGGLVLRRGSWRCTSSWEPILMLAKSGKYFCDGEACKTPHKRDWFNETVGPGYMTAEDGRNDGGKRQGNGDPSGANLRDVWTIAAEPLSEKHYAAFPTELVHRCLAAGTSAKGYCPECGGPWVRVIENPMIPDALRNRNGKVSETPGHTSQLAVGGGQKIQDWRDANPSKTLGWKPSCSCPPHEPRPGLVLDPFSGSGRTGVEAMRMGLDFVGVELNPSYVEMSRKILWEEMPLFS